jgi:trimethylamine--corrinoid protein Co-methyltransferase
MNTSREPIRFLSHDEMQIIHRKALRILAEVGMRIEHEEALTLLEAAGCRVDRHTSNVRFPEGITERYVEKMQEDFASRTSPESMSVRYSHVRFLKEEFRVHSDFTVNAGGYNVFLYDLRGIRRPASLQDTREALKLVAQLDQITHTGLPVAAQDVPQPLRQIVMCAELVKHTTKLGGIEAFNRFDIEHISRIGEIVRGSREELRRNPILVGYAEARSPLCIDHNMADILIEYVKQGMPQSLDTMPNAGVTAPIHPAAVLAQGLAETLGGMVLAYAVDAGACVTIDITPSFSDLSSMLFKYAGSERVALLGSRIQLISEYFGCPSGVHGGKTDSLVFDVRNGVEKAISMIMPILCGAVGFGTVGQIENALTFSPAQLVMDNEIARFVRRSISGFAVQNDDIDIDQMKNVGIGGHYLYERDTADRYREFLNLSPFFKVEPWGSEPSLNTDRDWAKMACDRAQQLLANEIDRPLSPEQEKEIDDVVRFAKKQLTDQGVL